MATPAISHLPSGPTRRAVTLAGLGGIGALLLAACGGTGAGSSGDAALDVDPASFKGQKLSALLITSHQGAADWLKAEYKKLRGVDVELTIVPYDEIGSTLQLDQQSGANKFDVAAPWYVSLGDLADAGAIKDLTSWIDADKAQIKPEDFIPSIYDPYSLIDGKRYGLPFDGDTHVLFYNKTILKRHGITTPPATWDEYVAISKKITDAEEDKGVYGNAVFGQKSPLILGASYANRLAGFGGSFLDESGKPALTSAAAVAAAENLVASVATAFPTAAETDFGVGNGAWFRGKVAFIENWTDLGVGSQLNADSTVKDQWGVVTLPVGGSNTTPRASLVAGFSWVIAGGTEKEALARDFIRFATSTETNSALLVSDPPSGIDPNRKSSLESAAYTKQYPELQKVNTTTLSGALAWPQVKGATRAAEVLTDELAKLIAGQGGTAAEALGRVQSEWEKILG